MNNTNLDPSASTTTFTINDLTSGGYADGYVEGLKLLGKAGGAISIIVPSKLAYGTGGNTGIPANACLRWDIFNVTVTNQ
jgi:FKBP-type peptidyl-prolyl cis-trans isomerase